MKRQFSNTILAAFSTLLVAACTTSGTSTSAEERLQRQIAKIEAIDRISPSTGTPEQQQIILANKQQAINEGIALLKDIQSQKIAANRECIRREAVLPADNQTCFHEQSVEDAQATLMVMLLEQMMTRSAIE